MPSPLLLPPPNLCAHFGAVKRLLFPGAEALMQTGFTKCCPQALCCCCHNNCRISDAKTVIDTCARVHCRLLPTLISILLWSTAWPHNGLQSFVFVHSDYWSVLMTSLCLKRTHTIDHTHTLPIGGQCRELSIYSLQLQKDNSCKNSLVTAGKEWNIRKIKFENGWAHALFGFQFYLLH